MRISLRWALSSFIALGACGQTSAPSTDDLGYKGTGIAVGVSPLTLESLGDACYSFAVVNGLNELVVGRGPSVNGMGVTGLPISANDSKAICASRFGNTTGGDISYVAPCDAQQPAHNVHVWVEALCVDGQTGEDCDEIQDYVNPCPSATGCSIPVACVENADTPVTFNFTIMGQADQGFFDIAVNFENIFCSAKLDTCYGTDPNTDAIELLFDADGNRAPTAVLALACTAGADTDEGTYLHTGNVTVTCGATVTTLDLSTVTAEGNQVAIDGLSWAAYFGSEALTGPVGSWNKEFFNVAITGFSESCTVAWTATASDGTLPGAGGTTTGVLNNYPVIQFGPTAVTAADGAWLCSQNPVNGDGSDVVTEQVDCTLPGDCLEGPCVTWQAGVQFPCDATPPLPPTTPIYASYPQSGWNIDEVEDVPPVGAAVFNAVANGGNGLVRPYTTSRMDLIYDEAGDRLISHNASGTMETTKLQISVFSSVSGTASVVEYATADTWGTVAKIQKPGNLFIANGFVSSGGTTHMLAAQPGSYLGAGPAIEGMNFYALHLEGTEVVVKYIGTVIPSNGGGATADFTAMVDAWGKVNPAQYRVLWLSQSGVATMTGPGFAPAQAPSKFHTNTFNTNLPGDSINTTPVSSPDAGTQRSFHGFFADGEHFVYTRATNSDPAAPGEARVGIGSIAGGADVFDAPLGVVMTNRWFVNFGTFNPTLGLWVSLTTGTATFSWHTFGTNPTAPDTTFVPENRFDSTGIKYEAIAPFH